VALAVEGGGPDVPADARNLAWRAAEAFLARASTPRGVGIRLAKRIPSGAGLGGGSSDAGAVLRGLAELLPGAVSADALRAIALGLGADVPFFLDPRPAEVSGIGERIALAKEVPALPIVVVHPGVALATADVYRGYAASGGEEGPDAFPALGRLSPESWRHRVRNDLAPAARRLCPRVAELERELAACGARAAAMSGSGSAVYGVFDDRAGRDAAVGRLALASGEHAHATETVPSR
jgi:4-diphosphocytidyl-2-C-methyl-D-erythritol kinase